MQTIIQAIYMQISNGGGLSGGEQGGYYGCGRVPGHGKISLTKYFWAHGICAHQRSH